MKKNIAAIFVSSTIIALGMGGAHADSSVTVNVLGTVNAATCDVSANTQSVNLGNAKPSMFTAINTPVDATKQAFSISLQNCDGVGSGQAQLKVTGPTTNAGSSYFSKDPSSIVAVSLKSDSSELSNGSLVSVGAANADSDTLNSTQVPFEVALKSSAISPAAGIVVEAPLTFSFVYN